MADTNTEALDRALDAGASISDINSIRSRHGLSQFQEVPATPPPAVETFEEEVGTEAVAVASPTEESFTEAPEEVAAVGPYEWSEPTPTVSDLNRRYVDAMNEAARASSMGQDPRPFFERVLSDPNYNADDRANKFLGNVQSAAEQIQGGGQPQVEAGQDVDILEKTSGLRSIVERGLAYFPLTAATATMYNNSSTTSDVPISTLSGQYMTEARAYVESIPTASQLTPKEKEDVAFLKYLEFVTAKVGDDIGWNWGTVADMAGFLAPQENLRYNEIAKAMGVDYTAMDMIDYSEFLSRTSAYVRSAPTEERQEMVEKLLDAWPEIHGDNRLALVDFLSVLSGDMSEGWRSVESAFERFDQATLGGLTIGKVFTGSVRGFNVIKTATKLKNVEAVADAITSGARGELSQANVAPIDALASLDPSQAINTLVKGADNTYATEVGLIQRDVDIYLDAADRVNTFGLGLSDAEKVEARNRAVKNLEDVGGIKNVRTEGVNDNEFLLSYEVTGPDGDVIRTTSATYTTDLASGIGFVSKKGEDFLDYDFSITSPNFRFTGDRGTLVQLPEQIQFQSKRIQGLYDGAIRSSLNGLSRREVQGIDAVLTAGDEFVDDLGGNIGKVFSRDEAVTEGINGVRLSDKQYQAYLDVRKVVDHLHKTKNKEIIDLWKAKGVKIARWGDEQAPVRVYEDAASALNGFRTANTRSHWVGVEGAAARPYGAADELDIHKLHEMYEQGYKLSRTTEGRMLKGDGTNLEWAFLKGDSISEPGGIVLNYRNGYMPKIKKDAFYFVKEAVDVKIGGRLIEGGMLKTVRYFDNFTDAERYTEELNAITPDKYRVLADREMSAVQVDNEFINISGGLFTGKRSEGVPFGLKGTSGERADSLQGLQRYIRNIARNVPMSLYREGLQLRWLNHAKDVGALPKGYLGSFEDAIHGRHLDLDNSTAKFLADAHKQISFISGIRTEEERKMLSVQRDIAKRLENFGAAGKFMSRQLLNSSVEGMTGAIRGMTFHLMLGLFSPAQFLIQATGSLIALSINPIHGAKAIGQMMGYATVDLLRGNPAQKAKMIESMRKRGFDMEGYELWDKSGLRESITTSNLDYHTIWSDKPYDANLLEKVLSNSSLFFKQGELVSARISFATAYNRWKEMNKGKEPGASGMKEIMARTEQYRLNMTRPNSAQFQQGLLSIPTQFQQVNTKFFEKLLGKGELTDGEKIRLLAAQSVLFGAAGVPLAKTAAPHVIEMINMFRADEDKISAENTSPETLNLIYNGALAWMIQDMYDVESVVTGRMALGQDFVENLFGLATEQVSMMDIGLGPFKSPVDASVKGVSRFLTALTTVMYAEEAEPEDFLAVGQILARSIGEVPSTTRNLYKSYDMTHSKFFKNKNGRPVAEWGDLNTQTIVAQAMGFSSQEVADYHELNMRNKGAIPASVVGSESDRIVRMLADMSTASDSQQDRWHLMAVNAIYSKYDRPEDRVRLMAEVKKKISEPTDAWGTLMKGVFRDWQSDMQNGLAEIHNQVMIKSSPAVAKQMAKRGMNNAVAESEEQQ